MLLLVISVVIVVIFSAELSVGHQRSVSNYNCREEGRFEDVSDCGSYVDCVSDPTGLITPYRRSCHGRAFDPSLRICTSAAKVPGCKLRQGRQHPANPRYQELCKDERVNFACGDCQTQITCLEKRAYTTKCEQNLRCINDAADFAGGVCHVGYDETCKCLNANSYRQDPYFNGTFFLCGAKDSPPSYYHCSFGMYFDERSKACVNNDGSPPCTEKGIFTFPEDCSRYYMCTRALEGWIQTKLSCPERHLFNEETEMCENPCEWKEADLRCEVQGRFKAPNSCDKFIECIDDLSGGFLVMERTCPSSFHWNDDSKTCVVGSKSQCKKVTERPLDKCKEDMESICIGNAQIPTLPDQGDPAEVPQIEERPPQVPTTTPEEGATEVVPPMETKPLERPQGPLYKLKLSMLEGIPK